MAEQIASLPVEKRAQSSSVLAEGGYLVDRNRVKKFWDEVLDDSLLSLVSSMVVPYDERVGFMVESTETAASWRAQNAAITVADSLFLEESPTELHSLATGSAYSMEWNEDARVEAFQQLANAGPEVGAEQLLDLLQARKIRRALNNAIINGSGVGTPLGILNDTNTPTTVGAITQAALEGLYDNLPNRYINQAIWLMNPVTWLTARGLTALLSHDTNANPYLIERRVWLNEYVPASTIIFGRMRNYNLLLSNRVEQITDRQSLAVSGRIRRLTLTRATGKPVLGTGGTSGGTAFTALAPA